MYIICFLDVSIWWKIFQSLCLQWLAQLIQKLTIDAPDTTTNYDKYDKNNSVSDKVIIHAVYS